MLSKALAVHPDPILRSEIQNGMRQRWLPLSEFGRHFIVAGLAREGQVEAALEELYAMRVATSAVKVQGWLYDLIVYVLCDIEEVDEAYRIMLERMAPGEPQLDRVTWYCLFDTACSLLHVGTFNCSALTESHPMHSPAHGFAQYPALSFVWARQIEIDQSINPTTAQCTAVLTAASREGDVKLATDVLRILSNRNTLLESVHYELLICTYVANFDVKTPLNIITIMHGAGIPLSPSTTRPLLEAMMSNNPQLTREAFEHLKTMRLEDPERIIPAAAMDVVVEATAKPPTGPSASPPGESNKRLHKAIERYRQLNQVYAIAPTTNTFNTLLAACVAAAVGQKSTAMSLASEMLAREVRPSATTYDHLISVCLAESERNLEVRPGEEDADFDDAKRYYREMRRKKRWLPKQATLERLIMRCARGGGHKSLILEILQIMRESRMDTGRIGRWLKEESEKYIDWGPEGFQME